MEAACTHVKTNKQNKNSKLALTCVRDVIT